MPSTALRHLNLFAQLGRHTFQYFVLALLQSLQGVNIDLWFFVHLSLSIFAWFSLDAA